MSFSPDSGVAGDGIMPTSHHADPDRHRRWPAAPCKCSTWRHPDRNCHCQWQRGAWSYATGTLADAGSHAFTSKAMDAAGNLSTASAALTVTVDTVAPGAPTVASFSPDSNVVGDGITNVNHVTLTGTAVAGSTVQVFDRSPLPDRHCDRQWQRRTWTYATSHAGFRRQRTPSPLPLKQWMSIPPATSAWPRYRR